MVMDSILADGPKGSMSSSRTTRPRGFWAKFASTSMGLAARASSCTPSTILPYFRKSVASMRYFPRTRRKRMSTISSIDLPTQASGLPMTDVSPNSGGTSGPMSTFGYPYRPTNTDGGLDPARSFVSMRGRVRCWE